MATTAGTTRTAAQRIRESLVASAGNIVFGMEDGTVSIFGLVFGVAASATGSHAVLLAGATGALAAPIERGAAVIERIAQLSAPGVSDDADVLHLLSFAASAVGDFVPSARLAALGIEGLRLQARMAQLAQLLLTQAFDTFYLGLWDVAMPAAVEADRLARETGLELWGTVARLVAAMVAAVRGEHALAEALTTEAEREFAPLGANPFLSLVQHARGFIDLARGRYADAYGRLRRRFVPTHSAYPQDVWKLLGSATPHVRDGELKRHPNSDRLHGCQLLFPSAHSSRSLSSAICHTRSSSIT